MSTKRDRKSRHSTKSKEARVAEVAAIETFMDVSGWSNDLREGDEILENDEYIITSGNQEDMETIHYK